jgi:membrane-bound lytic murein transglycosylase D
LKHIVKYILLLGFLANAAGVRAQLSTASDSLSESRRIDPIVMMLDSLEYLQYFSCNSSFTDSCMSMAAMGKPTYVPIVDDLVYEARLAKLNELTPFDLVYNSHVRKYIDLYAVKRRNLVARLIGLSQVYFPLFEEKLAKYNLPLELKYLAIVESALNPRAISKSGAAGLWQFMYPTGKMFGLDVNSFVDKRYDTYHATEAACQYFQYLYRMFGDWQMVLAAYNCGPGTLSKAIRRSGFKTTYWEVRPFLPAETQGYVPAFIAVNYVMHYAEKHHIYPVPIKSDYLFYDTLFVKQRTTFEQINAVLKIPYEDLKFLNPTYKLNTIPGSEGAAHLCLPQKFIGEFLAKETEIYNYRKPGEDDYDTSRYEIKWVEVKKNHRVQKGENLNAIARKYNCTADEVKQWNKLKTTAINPGRDLIVYVPVKTKVEKKVIAPIQDSTALVMATDSLQIDSLMSVQQTTKPTSEALTAHQQSASQITQNNKSKAVYHTIEKGDTLWNISNRYKNFTVDEIIHYNNLDRNKPLVPGQKLKVGLVPM